MSIDRDSTRLVLEWLREPARVDAERVLVRALDQVDSTRQRRSWWPARRFRNMNTFAKVAIAAAAVIVALFIGANLLPRTPDVGNGTPTPAPLPSAGTPSPTEGPSQSDGAAPLQVGSLVPGTTYRISDPCCVGPAGIYFTALAGWESSDPIFIGKNVLGDPDRYDILLGAHLVGNVYADGCHWLGTALDPPVGPTVDDLATALVAQGGPGTAVPTDVTIGGYMGKKVELSIPASVDVATCDKQDGFPIFGRWSCPCYPIGAGPGTYGTGQRNTVYIVDVKGTRQVIDTMYLPGTSAENLAELDQIIASIRFEP